MPKTANYTDEEILLALIWTTPKKMTKGQIGRLLGIKSAGQKHWSKRLEKIGMKRLLSVERLDTGEMFFGSPILTYYLTEANFEEIWRQYIVNDNERNGVGIDPFLSPFSEGIWNATSSPEFSKLVGSGFNYQFICAKNEKSPINPQKSVTLVSKTKITRIMEAVLSICWETEAYRRKTSLVEKIGPEQKKAYRNITSLYDEQIKAHPGDYRKFTALFEKNFKTYL